MKKAISRREAISRGLIVAPGLLLSDRLAWPEKSPSEGNDYFPLKSSEVRMHRGSPTLFINGKPHTGLTFFFCRVFDSDPDIRQFALADINLFSGCFGPTMKSDGTPDFEPMRERLDYVIAANPKVLILPRTGMHYLGPQHPLYSKYPGERQVNIDPDTGESQIQGGFSFSSTIWRETVTDILPQVITWLEENYGEHILGYHIAYGAAGEWCYSWSPALSDYSEAQVRAFRSWLRKKYKDDASLLRHAWAQSGANFETAEIPLDRTRKNSQPSLLYPEKDRQVIDYLIFHSAVMADALLHCVHTAKQTLKDLGRRKVCGAFYGYQFKNMNRPTNFFNQGHFASDAVLNSPDVDFVCAPYCYSGREPGNMYLAQLAAGSVRVHDKLHWCEDDTFTFLSKRVSGRSWCPDRDTTNGVLRRNLMGLLREGGTAWYMDCGGNGGPPGSGDYGWYRDKGIMATFAGMQAIYQSRLNDPDRSPVTQVAVFTSDASTSYMRQDESLSDALIFQQMYEFGALGCSFDTYRVEDLCRLEQQPWWKNYRLLVFLDALFVSPRDSEVINRAAKKDGRTILWVYGAGFLTEDALSVEAMEELTGIRVMVRHSSESLLVNCFLTGTRIIYGTGRLINPVFFGDDPRAHIAGWYANTGDPCILERDMGEWRSVWSGAPTIPAAVLRYLARQAGAHIYLETGDQVLAERDYLSIHACADGNRLIKLPAPGNVTDADTGKVIARNVKEFTVTMKRGQTNIWKIKFTP